MNTPTLQDAILRFDELLRKIPRAQKPAISEDAFIVDQGIRQSYRLLRDVMRHFEAEDVNSPFVHQIGDFLFGEGNKDGGDGRGGKVAAKRKGGTA